MARDRIWKFPLKRIDEQTVSMPRASQPLHVGYDPGGDLCLWALIDPDEGQYPVSVYLLPTGYTPGAAEVLTRGQANYVGTVVEPGNRGDRFVWHVYVEAWN
jgi:hypothetical protein